jgi:hypothetical protein
MTTVTFDTLELVERLKTAGFPQAQAESIVRVIAEAQDNLVTKQDLEAALYPLKTDLVVLKWMMGILIAGVMSIVLKTFS